MNGEPSPSPPTTPDHPPTVPPDDAPYEPRLRYEFGFDDVDAFGKFHARHAKGRRGLRSVMGWVILLAMCLLLLLVIGSAKPATNVPAQAANATTAQDDKNVLTQLLVTWGPLALIGVLVYLFVFRTIRGSQKQFKGDDRKYIVGCREATLMAHTVCFTTPLLRNAHRYSAVREVLTSDTHAFIYVGENSAIAIPRGKVVEGQFDRFIEDLRRRVAQADDDSVNVPGLLEPWPLRFPTK